MPDATDASVKLFVAAQDARAEWDRLKDRAMGTMVVPQRFLSAMSALAQQVDAYAPKVEAHLAKDEP